MPRELVFKSEHIHTGTESSVSALSATPEKIKHMMPNVFRVYTGADGLSHIEEIDLPFEAFTDAEGA